MRILLALAIAAIAYGFYSNYGVEKTVAEEEVKTEEAKTEEAESTEQQSSLFDTQLEAVEKAKNVESILQESADRRRAELDGQ